MDLPFSGSWQSIRSTIPGYAAGREWLRFSAGEEHVWEVAQPSGKGRPSVTRFTLGVAADGFRFHPVPQNGKPALAGWPIRIERVGAGDLAVTPSHGFTTVFRRVEAAASLSC